LDPIRVREETTPLPVYQASAEVSRKCRDLRESSMDVRCRLFDRTYGWVRNQIRREVAVERRKRSRLGGREPEANVAIGADHDHAARRDAGADGIDAGVVRDLHELGPALA